MYRLIDFRPVDAHQWRKNGDHPSDNSQQRTDRDAQEVFLTEGKVVRRFIHPNMDGDHYCAKCGNRAKIHGWIDQGNEGLTVCPGDWVVSMGPKYLVISDHNFQALFYSTVSGGTPPEPMQAVSYSSDKPAKPRVGHNEAFTLDKIIHECEVKYNEIAPGVMTCSIVHHAAEIAVTGYASALNPEDYNSVAATSHAYADAKNKLQQFENYRRKMNTHREETSDRNKIAVPKAPTPFGGEFDIGMARRRLMDGCKVAHRDWDDADEFVFYVPPGKYPASRNGNGTLLGLYPEDLVPYDGYLAMKTKGGSVIPWQPTMYDMLKVGWYLVE